MKEYHKIDGLFARDENKKLMPDVFRSSDVCELSNHLWTFTEKIDGTNVRVHWDGHRVTFAGRTDNAQLPGRLKLRLEELFGGEANEQIFEQYFGEKSVTIYGEGYGAKIQSGGSYLPDRQDFIVFDVEVFNEDGYGIFLTREGVEEVAKYFGADVVPVILIGSITNAIDFVKARPNSRIGTAKMEGLVGVPLGNFLSRTGKRIIVKIKVRDFDEIEGY